MNLRPQYYLILIFFAVFILFSIHKAKLFNEADFNLNDSKKFFMSDLPKNIEFEQLRQQPIQQNIASEVFQPLQNSPKGVIIYNRIPKTGSTTFANICNKLSVKNHFWTVNLNASLPSGETSNVYVWPPGEQREFLYNITSWTKKQPALYHGHFSFIQPDKFLIQNANLISYINIIRNPLDRLVSYYYFLRYGDDFRPNKTRKNHNDHRSIDECVVDTYQNFDPDTNQQIIADHQDCGPEKIWMQVPFFCGQYSRCWDKNSRKWAYEMAVNNFYKYYSLVGYTDAYEKFFEMLDDIFPEFFGKTMSYINDWGGLDTLSLRHTKWKQQPSEETVKILQATEEFHYESQFYELIKKEFDEKYSKSYSGHRKLRKAKVNYNKVYYQKGKFRDNFRGYA